MFVDEASRVYTGRGGGTHRLHHKDMNMRLRKPMKTADEYDALTKAKNVHHFRPGERKKIKKAYNKKERRWLNRILMMGAK